MGGSLQSGRMDQNKHSLTFKKARSTIGGVGMANLLCMSYIFFHTTVIYAEQNQYFYNSVGVTIEL